MNKIKRVCVYCGSSSGIDPAYEDDAQVLGKFLARRNIGLVYGGGRIGLMGALADAVLRAMAKSSASFHTISSRWKWDMRN
jgi:cytokinin riboside 5'-monophosphate phosphoribohydrolase